MKLAETYSLSTLNTSPFLKPPDLHPDLYIKMWTHNELHQQAPFSFGSSWVQPVESPAWNVMEEGELGKRFYSPNSFSKGLLFTDCNPPLSQNSHSQSSLWVPSAPQA